MNIHTPFKSANSKFFEYPYPIDPRFLSYGFGSSISTGLNQGTNIHDPKLSTIKESFDANEREVSGILRRHEHSQNHEELAEQILNLSQEVLFNKGKECTPFAYPTTAHISPMPSSDSLQGSIHPLPGSRSPSENKNSSLKDDPKEKLSFFSTPPPSLSYGREGNSSPPPSTSSSGEESKSESDNDDKKK